MTNKDELLVLWTSGDREVALKMGFMYTYNAKKYEWWDHITLLVWGPSAKLLTHDLELQKRIAKMQEKGVKVMACKGCSDSYGITEKLEALDIEVVYTGTFLTEWLKSGKAQLTI